ncbi:unnamed protein product [Ranitomeya imitator]|uniref:IQCH-like ATP-grasp domain-containing protein n=1 Tax=Ranitomeya imitator TaxID=111125 RepID=A0ABN9MHL0_9NEOB|nr:unnamed protein product [Ranitomeya imitator]
MERLPERREERERRRKEKALRRIAQELPQVLAHYAQPINRSRYPTWDTFSTSTSEPSHFWFRCAARVLVTLKSGDISNVTALQIFRVLR